MLRSAGGIELEYAIGVDKLEWKLDITCGIVCFLSVRSYPAATESDRFNFAPPSQICA